MENISSAYLEEAFRSFRGHKRLAEGAFAQLNDEEFFRVIDSESNSVAVVAKHLAGNMRSRFTDFLSTDGEKPDRHRDQEFIIDAGTTRAEVMAWWEEGWKCVLDTVQCLVPDDLGRIVTIRGQEHTVLQAINRQIAHYAYHVGQIVFLAKHLKASAWKTLSVPRGKSTDYNAAMQSNRPKEFHHP
jgi:Protein of unknown function (DUF1572)